MTTLRALLLCLCALAVVSCSDDDDTGTTPDPTPTDNKFQSRAGDRSTYDIYRLDENDQQIPTTATYSTRTVVHTNMTFQGESNVTMAVDSLFTTGSTEVERVDTIYYRIDGNSMYIYNFAETFVSLIPPEFPLQFEPVPGWVKVAELKEGTSQFTSQLRIRVASTTNELVVTIQGSNKGKQTVEGYTVFHQELSASATVITSTVTIPIILDIGGVNNATNSPSTLVRMQIGKFTNPIDQEVITGRTQILAGFQAGS